MRVWEVSIGLAIQQTRIARRRRFTRKQESESSWERNHSCLWVPEASSTCLNVPLARSHECVVRPWPQKLEAWACKWTRMQFHANPLGEMLGENATTSMNLHLRPSAIEWPKTIVTDVRDVYDKVSTEKGGLPQQKALTLEIATIREWLVTSGAQIRWTADENRIMHGLSKDHTESRQHLARPQKNRSGKEARLIHVIRFCFCWGCVGRVEHVLHVAWSKHDGSVWPTQPNAVIHRISR